MIAKTVYVSDDGKTFTDQKQCQDYEQNVLKKNDIALLWHNNVTMYNYQGETISTHYDPETEPQNFIKFIKDSLNNKVTFLRINPKCNFFDWMVLYNYFTPRVSTRIPPYLGDGLWRYDLNNEQWSNYKDELTQFKDNWRSFCTID